MSANASEKMVATPPVAKQAPTEQQESQPGVPKKIVNAQTVCNEKNEKGKLCNGHLKQLKTGGEPAEAHLRGNDVLFKCQTCGTLYMGPPLGHLRDPDKQQRFVERELTALLQAAGGTLPAIVKNERGVYVLAEETGHGRAPKPAPAATAAAKPVPAKPAPAAEEKKAPVAESKPKPAAVETKPAPAAEVSGDFIPYVPPPAPGPVPGETQEQKLARLRAIVAEAKRRKALAGGDMSGAGATTSSAKAEPSALARDSSTAADAHRPAAEAQAATGQASAAPMSPAAATASPAAGAESVEDLAPEASTELTPGAPPADEAATAQPAAKAKPAARTATGTVTRQDYDTGPVPGETHEQKIARLTALVEEVKRRAGKL